MEKAQKTVVGTKRTITVHARGEISCPPDLFSLTVVIKSVKKNAEEAQSSVKRRTEYILQVLRSHGIKEKQVKRTTDTNRDGENGDVCVQTCLMAQSDSLQACESVKNLVIEKLDATVQCGSIGLHHSSQFKAERRCIHTYL